MSQLEVVKRFLRLRRDGCGADAAAMLHEHATVSCPYGEFQGSDAVEFLADESSFANKAYLDESAPLVMLDNQVISRKYKFKTTRSNVPGQVALGAGMQLRAKFVELYFVEDGKVRNVYCNKLNRHWLEPA
jgi:hypothetical protein